tara:strand:+ start:536 stop:2518 length:1983 start_codon:yes stop_codon:yes gene_type:complete
MSVKKQTEKTDMERLEKCNFDPERPCSKSTKSKKRYRRSELVNIYLKCFKGTKKSHLNNKNMKVLCSELKAFIDKKEYAKSQQSEKVKITSKKSKKKTNNSSEENLFKLPSRKKMKLSNLETPVISRTFEDYAVKDRIDLEKFIKILPRLRIKLTRPKATKLFFSITRDESDDKLDKEQFKYLINTFKRMHTRSPGKKIEFDARYNVDQDDKGKITGTPIKRDSEKLFEKTDEIFNTSSYRVKFVNDILAGNFPFQDISYRYTLKDDKVLRKSVSQNKPCNILNTVNKNGFLRYLTDELGVFGHPFLACNTPACDDKRVGIKIMPFESDIRERTIREHMDKMRIHDRDAAITNLLENDEERPESIEVNIIYLFSNFVLNSLTPHIMLPIMAFNCKVTDLVKNYNLSPLKRAYDGGRIYNLANVLISEWATGGNLKSFIKRNQAKWYSNPGLIYNVMFFQLIYTMSVIHKKYPGYRHNDMKVDNVLVTENIPSPDGTIRTGNFLYKFNNNYYLVPNIGFQIKLWDFDYSSIDNSKNDSQFDLHGHKVDGMEEYGIRYERNQYYDIHCFFNYLRMYVLNDRYTTAATSKFLNYVIPRNYQGYEKYSPVRLYWGRVVDQVEYLTSNQILEEQSKPGNFFGMFPISKKEAVGLKVIAFYDGDQS